MNMVGGQDRSSSKDGGNTGVEDSFMPTTLVFTPTAEETKYWVRGHRTFVASSASGMVASGVTVSRRSNRHSLMLILQQFPLDAIKTRMQSYVNPVSVTAT